MNQTESIVEITKGQQVWLVYVGRNASNEPRECIVDSVGKKYIHVDGYKFYRDSLRQVTEYSSNTYLYLDIQAYYDNKKRSELIRKLKDRLSYNCNDITLQQLIDISAILTPTT